MTPLVVNNLCVKKKVVIVIRPLPRDGNMVEDHGAPDAGQLSRASTRGRRATESRQRTSGAESVAGQSRMRREMSWDGWRQALHEGFNSANFCEIRAYQKTVSVAAKTREDTASVTREHKFFSGNRKMLCVKEFRWDSTHLGERERGIGEGAWRGESRLHRDEMQVPWRRGRTSKKEPP